MNEFFLILISTIFVNNFVLVKFLGLCPFMGVSKKLELAIGMGFATTFVLTLSSISSYFINTYILQVFDLEYLRTIAFIITIATVVGFTELLVNKTSPVLRQSLGVFLPLITSNCAVLGVAILALGLENTSLLKAVFFAISHSIGFALALIIFASIREHLELANIPKGMKGVPINLLVAGLLSLAFLGFTGLV